MAQFHHQVKEVFGLVGLKRDHKLLVIQAEGIGGIQADGGVLVPDFDVFAHHALARRLRQTVPGARFDKGVDEQVAEFPGSQAEPRPFLVRVPVVADVGRALGHGQEGIRRGQVFAEVG